MILNLPEAFFRREVAVHVPAEQIEDFVEACFTQYKDRTEPNDGLCVWACSKAAMNRNIFFYHNKRIFTACTDAWPGKNEFIIMSLADVLLPEQDVSDILDFL